MSFKKLPKFDAVQLQQVVSTLTLPRLGKYRRATMNDDRMALRLYMLNTSVSAAFLVDLHYVEIALRNKFDAELTAVYGQNWFTAAGFLALLDHRSQHILVKAQNDAARHFPRGVALPPGKVIAELTLGFWLKLTDPRLEHTLWVPCLHKAFLPRKAPKRSVFNQQLEKLRQLRNRIAHHEPIFHMDLAALHKTLCDVARLLCPSTAALMEETSSVRRERMALTAYCKRRAI